MFYNSKFDFVFSYKFLEKSTTTQGNIFLGLSQILIFSVIGIYKL